MRIDTLWSGRVIHLMFPSQYELTSTLLRFQEHYESPQFTGKIFTLGQYRQWYTEEYGSFSYYSDWSGFNFPDTAVTSFLRGLFDPLTKEEQRVVDVLRHIQHPYYVIGTYAGNHAFEHELRHAAYRMFEKYRLDVKRILKDESLKKLKKWLIKEGYSYDVLDDECQAYIATDLQFLKKEKIDGLGKVKKKLNEAYREAVGTAI